MRLRSLLFVPGDSEKKFAKASQTAADVLILDLEDSVAPAVKPEARGIVAGWLDRAGEVGAALFVRPNPLDSGLIDDDLAAVVRPGLAGLLIPKANGAEDIAEIARKLDRLEAEAGMAAGTVKIAVVSTETPLAMFNLQSYTPPHPRLVGLTWGRKTLAPPSARRTTRSPTAPGPSLSGCPRAVPVRLGLGRGRADRHALRQLPRSRGAGGRLPQGPARRVPRPHRHSSRSGRHDQPLLQPV
ncbi:HpcH/HpaI aldolase/citrate lyase family protein [Novosphingobium resinovorum]